MSLYLRNSNELNKRACNWQLPIVDLYALASIRKSVIACAILRKE